MKKLNQDLKTGQFHKVYLLCGEEAYLKKQYKYKIKDAIVGDDTMNYAFYEGKGVSDKEIIDLAETMPFFAERRLIVLEDTGFLKSGSHDLGDYVREMSESTVLVFVESEVDKRNKLYKAIKDIGCVVDFTRQDEETLVRWILGFVQRETKQMDQSTARFFLNKVGTDMENIRTELEKLLCYSMDCQQITVKDIEAICTTQISNKVFDMVNAVAEKKQRKALDFYYDLLALKEPPMRILFLLTKQFKQLLEVKEMDRKGLSKQDIGAKIGMPPFAVGKCQIQAKSFRTSELRGILEESVEIEEAVKTGRLNDMMAVELFIMKYSTK